MVQLVRHDGFRNRYPSGKRCGFESHQGHMKKEDSKERMIKHSEEYIEFLQKRLASENYKASVTEEVYNKTKAKLNKEKLILKFLKL